MRTLLTKSFFITALCALLIWPRSPVASADAYAPRVGQRHPDFTLPSIDGGKPVSLSRYRGKKVLLIHFASW